MTVEQIEAIRVAQAELKSIKDRNSAAEDAWEKENLSPLRQKCDHTYPWDESAKRRDFSSSDMYCQICNRCGGY